MHFIAALLFFGLLDLCLLSDDDEFADDLFDADGYVIRLNYRNFDELMYNRSNAFIVLFYASYCGHCMRFAPNYQALARDLAGMNG
ncbi:unnamed protein product [Soboliphyme baturini]|uniref:Thioredoxin domain-containing protein n=1 Tax=Soboliphyme baturini TaxID=241478 RepID=A0A183JA19_9BILA|nr:unnamed protein product [Soboliphyme baturini]